MSKRELHMMSNSNPLVNLTETPGNTFKGKLVTKSSAEGVSVGMGTKYPYEFSILDSTARIVKKGNKKADGSGFEYPDTDVNEGDTVTLLATRPMHIKLMQAEVGETLELIYNGKVKGKKGNSYHDVTVNVEE